MANHYTFNTRALFILNKVVSNASIDLAKIVDNPMLAVAEIPKAIEASRNDLIEFLAVTTRQKIAVIEEMDALEFIEELEAVLYSIDWQRLGKLRIAERFKPLAKVIQEVVRETEKTATKMATPEETSTLPQD